MPAEIGVEEDRSSSYDALRSPDDRSTSKFGSIYYSDPEHRTEHSLADGWRTTAHEGWAG